MKEFRVTFIRTGEKDADDQVLGTITLDDTGTSRDLTIAAKAYRRATEVQASADKLLIQEIG